MLTRRTGWIVALAWLIAAGASPAQFMESEPNDTDLTANNVNPLGPGGTIQGTYASGLDVDYFLITTPAMAPGIYRFELTCVIASAQGGPTESTLRGEFVDPPCIVSLIFDEPIQLHSAQTQTKNAWYGFGPPTVIIWRTTRTNAQMNSYTATLTVFSPFVEMIGNFPVGSLNLELIGIDGESWVYQTNAAGIPNPVIGTQTFSTQIASLPLTLPVGTYYVATGGGLVNSLCSAVTGHQVTTFPNVLLAQSVQPFGSPVGPFEQSIRLSGGTKRPFTSILSDTFSVDFKRFTVGQGPSIDLSQPAGTGSNLVITNAGTPNLNVFNFFTLNPGNFPNGWFSGLDLSIYDIVTQATSGIPPFVTNTGPTGTNTFVVPGPLPTNLCIYFATVPFNLDFSATTPLKYTLN